MRRPVRSTHPRAVLLVAALLGAREAVARPATPPAPSPPESEELVLSGALSIRVRAGREIEMLVRRAPGEDYASLARRYGGSQDRAAAIERANDGKAPETLPRVRIPLGLLSNDYRALVLLDLFPRDRRDGADWIHLARSGKLPTYDEGLWQVADWFTGDGSRYPELARANRLAVPELASGQEVRILGELLHPAFRAGPTSEDGSVVYGSDAIGPFAGYRLKAGEALYSAVVVRLTGRTDPDDVNAVADELAKRSDIRDVTDIPVGFLIKIPLELLEPEFLPPDDPRRREVESVKKELAEALAREPVATAPRGLEGVLVIVDPGHGGRDLGTMNHGIWEHDYVYDVACRLRRLLETRTSARVFMTLEDAETGCKPSDRDRLRANRRGTIRTDPPFEAREEGESSVGVNLRWYLANSIYRKAVREGTDRNRVLFLSLHADARHPSLRGLMVYVPGERYRRGVHGDPFEPYTRYREVREQPTVTFSHREMVRSEAVSRRLAGFLVDAFRTDDLAVQPFQPVRDRVIRGRRTWLPAVLRGNAVPAKVLLEMVNMTNTQDAAVLGAASDREKLAKAIFTGVLDYFGEAQSPRAASSGPRP